MTEPRFRAVLDTNVVVAALLSKNAASPTLEIIRRWRNEEFELLYSQHIGEEYVEKLFDRRADILKVAAFLSDLATQGILVSLEPQEILRRVPADSDDDAVLACAIVGRATHLVTYDPHLHALGARYQGLRIVDGLRFLYALRGDVLG
jgi:putative PIN family toxin of toxin-antitoxin system